MVPDPTFPAVPPTPPPSAAQAVLKHGFINYFILF
jgi:hypothetical protein